MINARVNPSAYYGLFFALMFLGSLRAAGAPDSSPAAPAIEARGVWLHPTLNFSAAPAKGRIEVREWVNRFANANFNFLLAWVTSEYVAALTDTNYQSQVPTAKWDVVGELIGAARESGLPVHVWYSFTCYKSAQSPEFNPRHGGNPAWAARLVDANGKVTSPMTDVCPLHPEAREWEIHLIEKMLNRYPALAGIHIEEPGYSYTRNCACDLCLSLFKNLHGTDEVPVISGPQAEDLKCVGTTDYIRQLRARLLKRDPKIIFSVNGGTDWRGDRTLGRDWRHWAEFGWLEYYAAQCYTADLAYFSRHVQRVLADMSPSCPVFIGVNVSSSSGVNPLPAILKEIDLARKHSAPGVILFSGSALSEEHLRALKDGPFKKPAAYPGLKR